METAGNCAEISPNVSTVAYPLQPQFPDFNQLTANKKGSPTTGTALEPRVGLEPTTFSLRMKCSTD